MRLQNYLKFSEARSTAGNCSICSCSPLVDPVTQFSSCCNAFLALRKISVVLERTIFSEVWSDIFQKLAMEEQTTQRASHITPGVVNR